MTLPYSSSTPADDPMKKEECHKAAMAVRNMLEKVKQREGRGGGVVGGVCYVSGIKHVVCTKSGQKCRDRFGAKLNVETIVRFPVRVSE